MKHDHCVATEKMEIVLLTRQRKIKLGTDAIAYSNVLKYRGLYLDCKLIFQEQIGMNTPRLRR